MSREVRLRLRDDGVAAAACVATGRRLGAVARAVVAELHAADQLEWERAIADSVSVQSRGSGECGYWVSAGVGGEGLGEVGEERLLAEPAGDRGGEEPFNGAFTAFGLAAE